MGARGFGKEVIEHRRAVVNSETELIWAMRSATAEPTATQSKKTRSSTLKQIDGSLTSLTLTQETSGDFVAPYPSHILMKNAFRRLRNGRNSARTAAFMAESIVPLARVGRVESPEPARIASGPELTACSDAEKYFVDTLRQIETGRSRRQTIVSVYHNDDGQAVALRKRSDESSALTLVDLTANDAIIPAGTIVGVYAHNAPLTAAVSPTRSQTYSAYNAGKSMAIAPIRLSPWAHTDELDQAAFGVYNFGDSYDYRRGNMIRSVTIDDFRQAAGQVLAMCGVS